MEILHINIVIKHKKNANNNDIAISTREFPVLTILRPVLLRILSTIKTCMRYIPRVLLPQ